MANFLETRSLDKTSRLNVKNKWLGERKDLTLAKLSFLIVFSKHQNRVFFLMVQTENSTNASIHKPLGSSFCKLPKKEQELPKRATSWFQWQLCMRTSLLISPAHTGTNWTLSERQLTSLIYLMSPMTMTWTSDSCLQTHVASPRIITQKDFLLLML